MAPLAPLMPAAADIGLHIIVTCQMSQAHRATMDKFVGAAFGAGSPTLFLSGERQEFPSSEFKVQRRPPGQAFLCRRTARKSSRPPLHRASGRSVINTPGAGQDYSVAVKKLGRNQIPNRRLGAVVALAVADLLVFTRNCICVHGPFERRYRIQPGRRSMEMAAMCSEVDDAREELAQEITHPRIRTQGDR